MGEGWHSKSSPYLPVPYVQQFFLVLTFTQDDAWASQPHSITLPVSLVPTLPLPISCRARLFVCTNLPPTAHCAKLMFHPQHIDHANVRGWGGWVGLRKMAGKEKKTNDQHLPHLCKLKDASSLTRINERTL